MKTQQHELSLALSGLSHHRGHVLRNFVTSVEPLCFPTLRSTTLGRPVKCEAAARVRAGIAITPPQYYTSSSVQQQRVNYTCSIITHPHSHPKQTLWVFGRAVTPPFLSHTPFTHLSHTQTRPVGVLNVASPPVVYHTFLGACELHFITGGTQDTIPGVNIVKAQDVNTGVWYLVSCTVGCPV